MNEDLGEITKKMEKLGKNKEVDGKKKGSSSGDMKGISTQSTPDGQTISYSAERIIGNGSFGVVFQATVVETGEVVAIKKVLQDKRFKNRELQIMRQLEHPNIVPLKHCFYSNGEKVCDPSRPTPALELFSGRRMSCI